MGSIPGQTCIIPPAVATVPQVPVSPGAAVPQPAVIVGGAAVQPGAVAVGAMPAVPGMSGQAAAYGADSPAGPDLHGRSADGLPAGLPAGALEIPMSEAEPELDSYEPPAAAGNGKFHFPGADWLRGVAGLFRWKGVQKNDVSDVARIENERRSVETMTLRPLSVAEQAMMARIFPSLEIPHFEQRTVGDCYLLAYLHALAKKPYGRHVLSSLIREEGLPAMPAGQAGDHWVVRFADLPEDIPVYPQDLSPRYLEDRKRGGMRWKELSRGDIGFRIIEVAFGRRRNRKDPERRANTFISVEGGHQWEVSRAIMGDMASSYYNYSFQREACISAFTALEGNGVAVTLNAGTLVDEPPNPPRWFIKNHGYDVVAVNSQAQTITISNPHGSETLVTTISYDEFFKYFVSLEMERVFPQKIKEAFGNGGVRRQAGAFGYRLTPHIPYTYDLRANTLLLRVTAAQSAEVWLHYSGDVLVRTPDSNLYRIPAGKSLPFGRGQFGGDEYVSPHHFEIANLGDGRIAITDLNSVNGTVVRKMLPPPYQGRLNARQEYTYDLSEMPNQGVYVWLGSFVPIFCMKGGDGHIYIIDQHNKTIKTLANGGGGVTIGRDDIGGEEHVSAGHVHIQNRDGYLVIRDTDSSNGTSVAF